MLGICGALTTAAGISLKHKKSETADNSDSSVEAVEMKNNESYETETVVTEATDNKKTVIKDNAVKAESKKKHLSQRTFRQSGNAKPADMRIPLIRKYVHIADN